MIWLSNSTLSKLRDRLRDRGQRPSLFAAPASGGDAELAAAMAEYGPLCEAMFLMMSADGAVAEEELDVVRGALRALSADALRSAVIQGLLSQAERAVAEEGRAARLEAVAATLREDPTQAEVAFVLAAAIAFADNAIADEENDELNALAERLAIDETTAGALLDAVEADLKAERRA